MQNKELYTNIAKAIKQSTDTIEKNQINKYELTAQLIQILKDHDQSFDGFLFIEESK